MMFSSEEVASISISGVVSIVGAVVSIIVIVCVAFAEFPEESRADHVTNIFHSVKTSGASFVIEETDTKSEACA